MRAIFVKYILLLAMLVAPLHVHAWSQDVSEERDARDFSINWSLGSIGFGGLFPFNDNSARFEGSVSALDIGVEHNRTNLGVTFSPFMISGGTRSDDDNGLFSILNLHFYWNAVSHRGMFFGPFAAVNYLFFSEGFHPAMHTVTAGIRAGFRRETSMMNMNLFSVESGIRIVDGRANFYVGTKIDLLPLMSSWAFSGWRMVIINW